MAWIESHTILIRHRKVIELAKDLRLKPVYVIGHLHALWHVVLEQQEDGDLTLWSDDFIADSSCYQGDAPQYVSLLQKHKWLNNRIIHDWWDYAGRYLESKYKTSNPTKLHTIREKLCIVSLKTVLDSPKIPPPNLTLPTLPNQKNPPKKAEFSKDFIEKAEIAKDLGVNIYQLVGFYKKRTKIIEPIPEIVLSKVLDAVLKYAPQGDKFPYFLTALRKESEKHFANENISESNIFNYEPSRLGEILKKAHNEII